MLLNASSIQQDALDSRIIGSLHMQSYVCRPAQKRGEEEEEDGKGISGLHRQSSGLGMLGPSLIFTVAYTATLTRMLVPITIR